MQWVAETLLCVRRILTQYADLRPPFAEVWEAFSQTNKGMDCTRYGMIADIARVVQDIGSGLIRSLWSPITIGAFGLISCRWTQVSGIMRFAVQDGV